ncbi:hypothetical protein [Streptomyces sp. NPDC055210]
MITERDEVAAAVVRELLRAGLHAYRGDDVAGPRDEPGAQVHLDRVVMGDVYVDWRTSTELRDAAITLFEKGIDPSHLPPVFRHWGAASEHMRDALLGILASAGFVAEPADPHTHGGAIRVDGFRHR